MSRRKNSRNNFTLLHFMVIVVIIGILVIIAIPKFNSLQDRAKEAKTKSASYIAQLAVEDYAVRYEGVYPSIPIQKNYPQQEDSELPFINFFLNSQKLENAFTGERSEPRLSWSNPPINPVPGGIYYYQEEGSPNYYVILGYGKYPSNGPIVELTH